MNKKICHLTTVHKPFDERIFHKECKTLVQQGYEVFLIAPYDKNMIVDGINIIALPDADTRLQRIFLLTFKAFHAAFKLRADIYHFHDPELLPIGVLLKLFTGKKVIYDVHEDYEQKILSKMWIRKEIRKAISYIFRISEKISAYFIDYVISADSYTKMKFNPNRSDVIANYPPLVFMNGGESKTKDAKKFKVIYVGSISEDRGSHVMVEAMKYCRHKDIELHLLGKADKELEAFFVSSANVLYHGFVPWENVSKYLEDADVGLVLFQPDPAYLYYPGENIIKLFEYMTAGLPIIISDFPKLKQLISQIGCGIAINPTDPRKVAETIEYLYENPDIRKQMGEKGRMAVNEKYNWERESMKLISIYDELLKN